MFSLFRHSPSDPHCIQGDWYLDPRCTVITWCPTQYPTNIQWCSRLRTQMLQTLQCQARGGVTASHTTHNFQVLFCKNNQIETISLNGLIQFEIRLKLVQNQQQKRFKPIKLVKKIKECWNPTNFAKNGDTGTIQISDLPGFWITGISGCKIVQIICIAHLGAMIQKPDYENFQMFPAIGCSKFGSCL